VKYRGFSAPRCIILCDVVYGQHVMRMSPVAMTTGSRSPAAGLDRAASTDSVLVRTHAAQVSHVTCTPAHVF